MTEKITTFKKSKDFQTCEEYDDINANCSDRFALQSLLLDAAAFFIEYGSKLGNIANYTCFDCSRKTTLLELQRVIDKFDSRLSRFRSMVNDRFAFDVKECI